MRSVVPRSRVRRLLRNLAAALVVAGGIGTAAAATTGLPPSDRTTINMGETPWLYLFGDPAGAQAPAFADASWKSVGLPYSADQTDTFLNTEAGGGDGYLNGPISWYRHHFSLPAAQTGHKVLVEFEGAHDGVQVFINGHLLPGISAVPADAQATHVVGFIPFVVDLTPYVAFDGSDQVLAVRAAKNANFFEDPGFSGAFRFGQADSGLFRPVRMFITNAVHIPQNVYSNLGTWGTYVATVSASDTQALIDVQTNVLNEGAAAAPVTLTTQIVDTNGAIVATAQSSQVIAPNGSGALKPTLFDQKIAVANPILWYPNNSVYGTPHMYKVFHIVSVNGVVVDDVQSPLGIRTITWDKDLPSINGKPHYLWGASGRYDYPALGASVPEEQKWRDLRDLAAAGGNLWRPGHSTESEEFIDAADAYGVMVVEPSGEGEGAFSSHCGQPPCDKQTLKSELHRDMIIRDRNHPSVLAWEADNGPIDTPFAQSLKALSQVWDPINTRVQADRTPNPSNGDILSCTLEGCEVLVKQQYPNNPAWGAEYWGTGTARQAWDSELAFAAPFLDNWRQSRAAGAFGIAQWYFADSPGESGTFVEGTPGAQVRSLGASMVDMNRFPKLLYYAYEAAWTPFSIKPVVHLAHHWNRSGTVQVNAFSNCPSVRLLVNGVAQGSDQVPNPWNSNAQSNLTQSTTLLPFQVHWTVPFQSGTVTAACLDSFGNTAATDTRQTAGAPDHVALELVPSLVKPDGTAFSTVANGSDASFVVAKVVDANGVVVPTASNAITFSVSGPATYEGGSEQYVTPSQPVTFHAPGDRELAAEGGLTKIALRSQFQAGTVTVTATSPGLGSGSVSYAINAVGSGTAQAGPPAIIVPPAGQSVTAGQGALFSVTAAGTAPLRFQWLRNGTAINGATAASYAIGAASQSLDGSNYAVVVSDAAGRSTTSAAATLFVFAAAAPAITAQPQSQSAVAGTAASFSVSATGSPTLAYQWFANGTAIAGATGSTLQTGTLSTGDNGTLYRVTIGNPVGSVSSANATLTVGAATAPTITAGPRSVAAPLNQPVTLSVTASGSSPLSFQWFRNNVAITGATGASFTIASVQSGDAGSYSVAVSNAAGSASSAAAMLSIAPPGTNVALGARAWASSTQDPVGLAAQNAVDGDLSTRWASSAGVDPSWLAVDLGTARPVNQAVLYWEAAYATAYQIQYSIDATSWSTAVVNASGHGGIETLSFPTVTARYFRVYGTQRATAYGYSLFELKLYDVPACGGSGERFSVIDPNTVKDNLTSLTWRRAAYTLSAQGAQFTQPLAASYCQGLGMRLPTLPEATGIAGPSDAACAFPQSWSSWTSTLSATNNAYAYVANSAGQASLAVADNYPGAALCTSGNAATLQPPSITTQPASQTVKAGATASFSVAATGTPPLSFQWLRGGQAIPGATDPILSVGPVSASDNGAILSVRVSGPTGLATTSVNTTLTVANANPPSITAQPVSETVSAGQAASFTVSATGTGTLSYQWYRDGTAIAGATGATYGLAKVAASDSGAAFTVAVSDGTGLSVRSSAAILTVSAVGTTPPTGDTDLVAIAAGASSAQSGFSADTGFSGGGTASWPGTSVVTAGIADAAPATVYQAERAGSFSYTLGNLSPGTSYTLRLHFAELYWSETGQRVFDVSVNGATVLSRFDVIAAAGGARRAVVKSFTAVADTQGRIAVAFTPNGVDQPELSGLELLAAGMGTTPVIITQPATQTVPIGQAPVFTVAAKASGTLGYQWFRNNLAIPGATAATYTAPASTAADGGSLFQVAVSSGTETVSSTVATLQVRAAGGLVSIAAGSGVAVAGFAADTDFTGGSAVSSTAAVSVSGVGNAAPAALYQTSRQGNAITYALGGLTAGTSYPLLLHFNENYWSDAGWRVFDVAVNGTVVLPQFDIVAVAGAKNRAVVETLSAVADKTGTIRVSLAPGAHGLDQPTISGLQVLSPGSTGGSGSGGGSGGAAGGGSGGGSGDGSGGGSGGGSALSITSAPVATTAIIGRAASFAVAVSGGTAPITYQWSRNGVAMPGATAATLLTPGTIAADNNATYSVVVSDAAGSRLSAASKLSVNSMPAYSLQAGMVVTDLNNDTGGHWSDAQIYVTAIGRNPTTGAFSWVAADGTLTPISVADNTATGHLTKNGQSFPNKGFTLAQSRTLVLPPLTSGRVYVSVGSPVFLRVLADANNVASYAGPNPQNKTDPNIDVPFDWYELTLINGVLNINTTQVDEFGLPLLLDVWGAKETVHQQVGINEPLSQLLAEYVASVPAAFSNAQPANNRIIAPAHASFGTGQANEGYLDTYIAAIWQRYASTPLLLGLNNNSRRFSGTTTATSFVFNQIDASGAVIGGPYTIQGPPSTQDVLLCNNGFATGNATELAIEAQLCAAFNRHVMEDPAGWTTPGAFYAAAPANFYASFWHAHAVGGLAYGFAYDDVSDQSASIVSAAPEHMAFGIGW